MKIAFYHGLESNAVSSKSKYLHKNFDDVYTPAIDYNDPSIFKRELKKIKDGNFDLIIGSSMGAYFAFILSTHVKVETILFNPALHSRTIDVNFPIGKIKSRATIVLGKNDKVVDPETTKKWLKDHNITNAIVYDENIGHRVPPGMLKKYIRNKKTNESMSYSKIFETYILNEGSAKFNRGDIVQIKPEFEKEYKKRVPKGDIKTDKWKITTDKGEIAGMYSLTQIYPVKKASEAWVMNAEEKWLEKSTFRK